MAALRAANAVPPDNPLIDPSHVPADGVERLRHLSRALGRLRPGTVLVLDDFEVEDRELVREVVDLVRTSAHTLHVVIVSRSQLDLPLHRLRAAGAVADIRSADLAFTASEAAELFRRHDLDLTDEDVTTLLRRTEGWPAGLQFAATFLSGSDGRHSVAEFAGDVRSVDEYLTGEVLAGPSAPLRPFLLRTSICEHLCAELADAITLGGDGRRSLEELERVNDFVMRVSGKPQWFRYHPLLRDVLQHRLLRESPAIVPELHRRAAEWHAAHGGTMEALEHAVAARDWAYLGHLVVTQAAPLILSAKRVPLTQLLQQVPPELLGTVAELMVCTALLRFHAGDHDAIGPCVAGARRLLQGRPDAERLPIEITLRSLQAGVLRAVGDMPRLLEEADQMLTLLSEVRFSQGLVATQYRAIALDNMGVGLLWTGRPDLAGRHLWAASTAAQAADVELVEIDALGHLALVEAMVGSIREAGRLAGAARELADRRGRLHPLQSVAVHLAAALTHIERNETVQAQRAIRQGRRARTVHWEAVHTMVLLGAQARLALVVGEPARAQDLLNQARRERDPRLRAPALDRWLLLAESRLDLRSGRWRRVEARYARLARAHDLTYAERVCRAHAAFAKGDLDRAAQLLAAPQPVPPETVAGVEERIIAALLADAAGDGIHAADSVAEALDLADQEGIRRPFVSMGDARLDVLIAQHLVLTHRNQLFADEILREIQAPDRLGPHARTGDLSERETEVLRYLPTMLTAADIAGELGVSVNTVKAHMRAIYRKLAAGRRQEAVTRARQRGLL
ncbi:LuxR C-terminal-related transcriptional regulator [Actinoplanes sp. NPDC049548]|uniref:LuxR C-terminal-related transcriptional regulator n=1 Tax=Actinoplanes sp. NPDC049548 TaxID=3155152 RepID=UPI0034187C39